MYSRMTTNQANALPGTSGDGEGVDYNYYTSPEQLQAYIEKAGGLAKLLTFCQKNHVYVHRESDWSYMAYINNGYWSGELDALSALVVGVLQYEAHPDKH